ncbi:MAG: hypothetical protein ABEH77_07830, partial [Halobacteriaceae archaeon]
DDSVSPETGQALLRGRTLTIVTIVGDLQAEGLSSSVTLEPVSAATRSVTVTNDSGKPINVSLPIPETTNATAWNQSAIAASIRENPSVLNTTVVGPQRVNISLRRVKSNQRQSFSLKLARVEVREQGDASTVDDPPGRYIIPVTGDNASMAADQTQRVAVEVRDRYNNPVDGANVTFQLFPPPASNKTIDDSYQFLPEKRPVVNVTTAGTDGRAATTFDPFAAEPSAAAERFGTGSAAINRTFPGPDTFNTANTTVNVFNVTVS